jgi:hypothetical protein
MAESTITLLLNKLGHQIPDELLLETDQPTANPSSDGTSVSSQTTRKCRINSDLRSSNEAVAIEHRLPAESEPDDPWLKWLAPDESGNGGGSSLLEWKQRDAEGHATMEQLRARWRNLNNNDFIAMKGTLGLCVESDQVTQVSAL